MPPKDQDQADENATRPLDEKIEGLTLQGGGALVASVVTELVDIYKHIPKPYAQASQGQQQDVFRRLESLAKTVVQQIAEAIAANGENSVKCVVGDAKVGSDIKVDLKLAPVTTSERDAAILFLAHARGRTVMVKMASKDEFDAESPADPSQPDQSAMEFEAGSDTVEEEAETAEPEAAEQ